MSARFVELALPVADILTERDRWLALGFRELAVSDAWSHPYTALTAGGLTVGLHGDHIEAATIVLARPGIAAQVRRSQDVEWFAVMLDDDHFHCAARRSPDGQPLLLVEAPTHAEPDADDAPFALQALALPCADVTRTAAFFAPYARATLAVQDEPLAVALDLGGLPLELAGAGAPPKPVVRLRVRDSGALVAALARSAQALLPLEDDSGPGSIAIGDGLRIAFLDAT